MRDGESLSEEEEEVDDVENRRVTVRGFTFCDDIKKVRSTVASLDDEGKVRALGDFTWAVARLRGKSGA